MKKTRIEICPQNFPYKIRKLFENAAVYDSSCSSDATVYYVDKGCYIKTGALHSLAEEARLTRLFASLGFGVEVLDYISEEIDYLITKEAPGEDLTHYLKDPEKLCALLSSALRTLHSHPASGVPLSPKHRQYLEAAAGSGGTGDYHRFVLMDRYMIDSREEALRIIRDGKHLLRTDTLIHGDACLPNVMQKDGRFSAFIDFSLAGVGDKHTDIYWALWSLSYNLKTEAFTDLFLDLYGREHFSEKMLRIIAAFEVLG